MCLFPTTNYDLRPYLSFQDLISGTIISYDALYLFLPPSLSLSSSSPLSETGSHLAQAGLEFIL